MGIDAKGDENGREVSVRLFHRGMRDETFIIFSCGKVVKGCDDCGRECSSVFFGALLRT